MANKEQYLLAFTVSVSKDFKIISEICVQGENILHGTGELWNSVDLFVDDMYVTLIQYYIG